MRPLAPRHLFARVGALTAICVLVLSARSAEEAEEADFVIRSWDRREGMPVGVVSEIQRASNGYLWLATQKGLVRFDGDRFKLFDAQSNPELRTNRVNCVQADSSSGLWVGTSGALLYYPDGRLAAGNFIEFGAHVPIRAFAAGSGNVVWALSTSNEVIQIANGKLTGRFNIPGDQPMLAILPYETNGVMVASPYSAGLLNEGRFLPLPEEVIAKIKPNLVCRNQDGGYWVAADRKVVHLTDREGRFQLTRIASSGEVPQSAITVLMEDRLGRLWAGTRYGAVHCFQRELGWQQVTPKRFSTGYISCLYEDAEGLIWVGTTSGYLHQIKRRQVTIWSLPTLAQDCVPHTVCVARDGTVWVGTDGAGAHRYQNGTVSRFGVEQGLSNLTVMAIFEDRQTNLWFGTLGGLFRFEQGRFKSELRNVFDERPVPAVCQSRAGDLWFGTVGAVVRKRGENVRTYPLGGASREAEVRAIAEDASGQIWAGTRGAGLFRLNQDHFEQYENFPRPVVNTIYCDHKGVMWIGTAARGLFRLRDKRPLNWTSTDGLPSDSVNSILDDATDTLWLSSSEGVFGVRKQALMERWRNKTSPLPTIHVAASEMENWSAGSGQPSAAKGPDGRLWFPLGHGVLSFHPADLMRERPTLPVLVEELLVDDIERIFTPDSPGLKIYTGMKRLEFRYTIADLDSPGRLKFRYQLEGLDNRWINGGVQRSATYGPLPPGKYRFRVISAGSGNVWTETANPLAFEIVPHFWQTAWFRAAVAFLVLSIVGAMAHFIGRAKLRRKLERLEMQQTMEKERQRIARDLHDDLGAGITEIMLLSELARREHKPVGPELNQIHSQLGDITQKARQVATAMDEIVWTVDPKNDRLPDLASYLCDYAREFLRAAKVSCRIDMMEDLPPLPVTAQQRHNLFMAVKESLNNAIKHSSAGEVWLRIRWADHRLTVNVEDNGRGFDPAHAREKNGNGLSNIQSRMDTICGKAELKSQAGQGTKIRLSLPLTEGSPAHPIQSLN